MSYSQTYLANQLGPPAQFYMEGQQAMGDSSAASPTHSWGVQNDSRLDSSAVPRQLDISAAHIDVSAGSASPDQVPIPSWIEGNSVEPT